MKRILTFAFLMGMAALLGAQGLPTEGADMQVERVELGEGQPPADPCEALPSTPQRAYPGKVLTVLSGDTLVVQLKGLGSRKMRLAGLAAPEAQHPLAAVSRYHLAKRALGQRVWVSLDGTPGPDTLVGSVEQLGEGQLELGLVRFREDEAERLSPTAACRARRLEAAAKASRLGLWR